jgi:hypothetical protein
VIGCRNCDDAERMKYFSITLNCSRGTAHWLPKHVRSKCVVTVPAFLFCKQHLRRKFVRNGLSRCCTSLVQISKTSEAGVWRWVSYDWGSVQSGMLQKLTGERFL